MVVGAGFCEDLGQDLIRAVLKLVLDHLANREQFNQLFEHVPQWCIVLINRRLYMFRRELIGVNLTQELIRLIRVVVHVLSLDL